MKERMIVEYPKEYSNEMIFCLKEMIVDFTNSEPEFMHLFCDDVIYISSDSLNISGLSHMTNDLKNWCLSEIKTAISDNFDNGNW